MRRFRHTTSSMYMYIDVCVNMLYGLGCACALTIDVTLNLFESTLRIQVEIHFSACVIRKC